MEWVVPSGKPLEKGPVVLDREGASVGHGEGLDHLCVVQHTAKLHTLSIKLNIGKVYLGSDVNIILQYQACE